MGKPDDPTDVTGTPVTAHVRSAFLRKGPTQCRWPDDFTPVLTADDPIIRDLALRLWQSARRQLEASDEGFNRLIYNQAIDRVASDLFANADIGIKQLASAKHVLSEAFGSIETACELSRIEAPTPEPVEAKAEAEPTLVARLDATPAAIDAATPGRARLCLSLGDVVLQVDLHVPPQSWLYRGFRQLRQRLQRVVSYQPRPGRLGMLNDDRELTLGLRHARQPAGRERETTFSIRSRFK